MRNTNSLTVAEAIEPGDWLRADYVALLLFFFIPVSLMGQNERSQDVFEKMFVGAYDPAANRDYHRRTIRWIAVSDYRRSAFANNRRATWQRCLSPGSWRSSDRRNLEIVRAEPRGTPQSV